MFEIIGPGGGGELEQREEMVFPLRTFNLDQVSTKLSQINTEFMSERVWHKTRVMQVRLGSTAEFEFRFSFSGVTLWRRPALSGHEGECQAAVLFVRGGKVHIAKEQMQKARARGCRSEEKDWAPVPDPKREGKI